MAHDLVVFSHLRWDAVVQRPQQLITRLARDRRIFYFQEPVEDRATGPRMRCCEPHPNVFICQPSTPVSAAGFHDLQLPFLREMLEDLLRCFEVRDWAAWFYTPMALPLISSNRPNAIIYDCLEELAVQRNSPRQLLQRETALLNMADVVLTSSRSLHQAKCRRHPRVHCFPASIASNHLGPARQTRVEPVEQARLPGPRLGYFGVIDERIDLTLIDALARAHPEWQLILVGPVVKIDPDSLPLHSNIYYFGQQEYADLPNFLAGWDLCLLPMALNRASRYQSPSKTLEYMVAERPIISTAVAEIVELYDDIVYCGRTQTDFIAACENALAAPAEERDRRVARMREVLADNAWDATAASIDGLISSVIQDGKLAQAAAASADNLPVLQPLADILTDNLTDSRALDSATLPILHERVRSVAMAVLGAGPVGLSAAYHLGEQSLLIEQHDQVGGSCRTIADDGFTFDCAGPGMFASDPYANEMYDLLLGDNLHWQTRDDWVFSDGTYTRYPFHSALYGLPSAVIRECILGAVEARFGPEKNPADATSNPQTSPDQPRPEPVMLPFRNRRRTPRNFEDFIQATYGAGIARHFALPYYSRFWASPLKDLEAPPAGGPEPVPDLEAMIEGALSPAPGLRFKLPSESGAARFGYPLEGGFQALMNGFVPRLAGVLKLDSRVVTIAPAEHLLTVDDGSIYHYETLLSTLPLPELIRALGDSLTASVREAAEGLRYLSLRWVSLGIDRPNLTPKQWIHYPRGTVFHRVFAQGNASPHCNPPESFGLSCIIAYSDQQPLPRTGKALTELCIADCIRTGLLAAADPVPVTHQFDLPNVALLPDHNSTKYLERSRSWLLRHDIILAGQDSAWQYQNPQHPFSLGRQAARQVLAQRAGRTATG